MIQATKLVLNIKHSSHYLIINLMKTGFRYRPYFK